MKDGSKPIQVERKPYRPKVKVEYEEPEYFPEFDDGLEILFRTAGKSLAYEAKTLPPRDDIIHFEPRHEEELKNSVQWADCPEEHRAQITQILKDNWDVFASEGMKKHIRGFTYIVDTGQSAPVCCPTPRYGPHESRVITQLVESMEENGLIEDDDGPWGALIVLAAKPNQLEKHWTEYIWRLCVSFRKLNAITRPFAYPTRRCDDAVQGIGRSKFFITMDLAWGYWQVYAHEATRHKLAFFTPQGKKRWTRMPMGALNSHAVFCAIMDKLKKEWNSNFSFDNASASISADGEVIVDDVFLHADTIPGLLAYFKAVCQVLKKYRVTVNLKKCRFLCKKAEFVGIDVGPDGNLPAESKFPALKEIISHPPVTATDVLAIIGFFGFYQEWIPYYEARVSKWRQYKKNAPPTNSSKELQAEHMRSCWTAADQELLQELGAEILKKPILKRPDFNRRFYLKTDWSKDYMGAALLQADPDSKIALEAELNEINGGPCMFDKIIRNPDLRLHPCGMISRACTKAEKAYHSYTGETGTGVWSIEKYRAYLYGRVFTWITDCSSVRTIFDSKNPPTHKIQRWIFRLLTNYNFDIVHRPARMMTEVDTLSRYNRYADYYRKQGEESMVSQQDQDQDQDEPVTTVTMAIPRETIHNRVASEKGPTVGCQTFLAAVCSTSRLIWEVDSAFSCTQAACEEIGCNPVMALQVETRPQWNKAVWQSESKFAAPYVPLPLWKKYAAHSPQVDWVVITVSPHWGPDEVHAVWNLAQAAQDKGATSVFIFTREAMAQAKDLQDKLTLTFPDEWSWSWKHIVASNHGSPIQADVKVAIFSEEGVNTRGAVIETRFAATIREHLGNLALLRPQDNPFGLDITESPPTSSISFAATFPPTVLLAAQQHEVSAVPCDEDHGNPPPIAFIERALDDSAVLTPKPQETNLCPVFDIDDVAPDLTRRNELVWMGFPFAVTAHGPSQPVRGVSVDETLLLLGVPSKKRGWIKQTASDEEVFPVLPTIIPRCVSAVIFESVKEIEDRIPRKSFVPDDMTFDNLSVSKDAREALVLLTPTDLNVATTVPLPGRDAWKQALLADHDLALALRVVTQQLPVPKTGWKDPTYATELRRGRLDQDEGVLYRYEVSARRSIRQLRTMVVPSSLRHVVISACHSSPFSGHSGEHKTLWKVLTKFWWPSASKDVTTAVRGCGHCRVSNITDHEAAQKLKSISSESPFDVLALDLWKPGDMPSKLSKGRTRPKALLTALDMMTAFAVTSEVYAVDSDEAARALVTSVFTVFGLPKLVIIDAGSEFFGTLRKVCELLLVPFHPVSKGNHKAILSERFHRYLNKVQRIHAVDCATFDDWLTGVSFATYGWNASPVDGTNIPRSYAAIGREFPLPIDIKLEKHTTADSSNDGERTAEHVHAAFPLLHKQRALLRILTEERREHHRALRNKEKHPTVFAVGDLVLVRVQVQTSNDRGPGKLQLKARGPFRVLEVLSDNTYKIQRIPFDEISGGRTFEAYKESAARMEKLPSNLVIHKHADGTDSRWATFHQPFSVAPLHHSMRAVEFGNYRRADGEPWAFEKIEDLWSEAEVDELPDGDQQEAAMNDDSDDALPAIAAAPPTPATDPTVPAPSVTPSPSKKRVRFTEDTDFSSDKGRPKRIKRRLHSTGALTPTKHTQYDLARTHYPTQPATEVNPVPQTEQRAVAKEPVLRSLATRIHRLTRQTFLHLVLVPRHLFKEVVPCPGQKRTRMARSATFDRPTQLSLANPPPLGFCQVTRV